MHKQDNTNRDPGLDAIMESMYTAAALEPLSEKTVTCDKCKGEGCDHCDNTGNHTVEEAPGNSLDDWNDKMNKDDDPSDQYNTEYQVDPELDAAADGSLIGWINKQTETNPEFVQKFVQFIQDTEGINPDDTGRIGLGADRPEDKWTT